jgi:hypothetical protein
VGLPVAEVLKPLGFRERSDSTSGKTLKLAKHSKKECFFVFKLENSKF